MPRSLGQPKLLQKRVDEPVASLATGLFLMVSTDLEIGISFIAKGRSGKIRSLWEVLIKGGRSTNINQLRTARKCSVL